MLPLTDWPYVFKMTADQIAAKPYSIWNTPPSLPKFVSALACCASMPQSSIAIRSFMMYKIIPLPPGDPVTISSSPLASKTSVGDSELRGRLPPATELAIATPLASAG